VLPEADPREVMDAALRRSVDRYRTLLSGPPVRSRPVRRAAELAYEVGYRVDPRRLARR
jgi:hypothetical protein